MEISTLYKVLIDSPSAPKPYRDLRAYYQRLGKKDEADAFTFLLREAFKELPSASWKNTDADVSNSDS